MNDGGHTIWLCTKGKNKDEVPPLLFAFLKYVDNPEFAASDDDFVKAMDERVKLVKQNRRWEDAYMQFQEMLADESEEGIQRCIDSIDRVSEESCLYRR